MSGPFGSSQWMYSSGGFYPHEIGQSLRFNDDDSAYLSWTPSSAGNRKTWTWSGWVKRGNLGATSALFVARQDASNRFLFYFNASDNLQIWSEVSNVDDTHVTDAEYRDVSAWYHIVLAYDTTQSTASDRTKIYVNGTLQDINLTRTIPQNREDFVNNTKIHYLGAQYSGFEHFDGYLAEVNFVDGQALDPTDFGEFKSGVWVANEYTGSYGTNGFYLPFTNGIGDDESGNSNDWTANNLAATDIVLDSPTNNFATLSPLDRLGASMTLSEGNLKVVCSGGSGRSAYSSSYMSTGSWYIEATGVANSIQIGGVNGSPYFRYQSGSYNNNGTTISGKATFTSSDILAVAYNADDQTIEFFKNNASQGSTTFTAASGVDVNFAVNGTFSQTDTIIINFGQDSSFAGNKTAQGNTDGNGIGDFYYTPPSGYLALCTANLPDPAIDPAQDDVPSDYFNTVLYTGDATTSKAVTGVGFRPDLVWIKNRNDAVSNSLVDAVRGVQKGLFSNSTSAEVSYSAGQSLDSFDADGFTVGSFSAYNGSGDGHVAWNWLAGNGTSSNTDGSITSTVSVNQKAGFSIVSYTGTNSATETIGHGLGAEPDMIIVKSRESTTSFWAVYHSANTSQPETELLRLNTTDATLDGSAYWNDTAPTSSVFTVGTSSAVNNGNDFIAYCFAEVEGYSKFGSYTGNGSTDGPFVYTGFRPAWVLIKVTTATDSWIIYDSTRSKYNAANHRLFADLSLAESQNDDVDLLSNGFKPRSATTINNLSGASYIYMAFAENPFKYANAR